MSLEMIMCPKCEFKFAASKAFANEIERQIADTKRQAAELLKSTLAARDAELAAALTAKQAEVDAIAAQSDKEKKALAAKYLELDSLAEAKANALLKAEEEKLRNKLKNELRLQMENDKRQISEQEAALTEARQKVLDLQSQKRSLEEKEKEREILTQERITEKVREVEEATSVKLQATYAFKDAEHERQMATIQAQLAETQRKLAQGSQKAQGEVMEAELEDLLKSAFRDDAIEEVENGVAGADIHQGVIHQGIPRGLLVWETKNTKKWSPDWITKLKDDQRKHSADFAILVSQALPKGQKSVSEINGVWVCDYQSALIVGGLLRRLVIDLHSARAFADGRGSAMSDVYAYLIGPKYKQRIEAIVDTWKRMKESLDREQIATNKNFKVRATQLERVINSTIEMYGDLQGIVGDQLQSVPALELESPEEDEVKRLFGLGPEETV